MDQDTLSTFEDDVAWGPWQSAVPGWVLASECTAARRIQAWWRRSRSRNHNVDFGRQSEGPLAFLTVADIARLHMVSFHHTLALCELGFSPHAVSEREEDEEGGEESCEGWSDSDINSRSDTS